MKPLTWEEIQALPPGIRLRVEITNLNKDWVSEFLRDTKGEFVTIAKTSFSGRNVRSLISEHNWAPSERNIRNGYNWYKVNTKCSYCGSLVEHSGKYMVCTECFRVQDDSSTRPSNAVTENRTQEE